MVLPLIPILCVFAIIGGGVGLFWYDQLSEEEQRRANGLANHYAYHLFKKTVSELSEAEAHVVHRMTRSHFN